MLRATRVVFAALALAWGCGAHIWGRARPAPTALCSGTSAPTVRVPTRGAACGVRAGRASPSPVTAPPRSATPPTAALRRGPPHIRVRTARREVRRAGVCAADRPDARGRSAPASAPASRPSASFRASRVQVEARRCTVLASVAARDVVPSRHGRVRSRRAMARRPAPATSRAHRWPRASARRFAPGAVIARSACSPSTHPERPVDGRRSTT